MCVITVNVDGLGAYSILPGTRMQLILMQLLPQDPLVMMFQEVTQEMYHAMKKCLPNWRVYRKREHDFTYFNATAVRTKAEDARDRTTCTLLPNSQQGRHVLTVRRGMYSFSNIHAESGGNQLLALRLAAAPPLMFFS